MMNFILKLLVAFILLPWSMIGLIAVVAMFFVLGGNEEASAILDSLEQIFLS